MENLKQVKAEPYRVVLEGPINGLDRIYQIFNRPAVEANNLEDSILFNQYVFTNTSSKAFPNSFLPV
jgi:hypothetical protein